MEEYDVPRPRRLSLTAGQQNGNIPGSPQKWDSLALHAAEHETEKAALITIDFDRWLVDNR